MFESSDRSPRTWVVPSSDRQGLVIGAVEKWKTERQDLGKGLANREAHIHRSRPAIDRHRDGGSLPPSCAVVPLPPLQKHQNTNKQPQPKKNTRLGGVSLAQGLVAFHLSRAGH